MLSSKAILFSTALGLFAAGSHAAYVYPRGMNASTPVTPPATLSSPTPTTPPFPITSCPAPSYLRAGTELASFLSNSQRGHYEQSYLSMYEKFLTDEAYFEKVAAAPSLKYATDPFTVSEVYSYLNSLYTAISTEDEYLNGASWEGIAPFVEIATDPCLFSTCTSQYWSHKSESSKPGNLWFNEATSPCCGSCTVYAGGVRLYHWPTPNPTPSITAYEFLPGILNVTVQSPTVVVILTDAWAANQCSDVGTAQPFGIGYFDPTWLSTSSIAVEIHRLSSLTQTWTAINFADFGSKCTCTTKCKSDPLLGVQTNLCTPQLQMPWGVTALDPAWATCGVAFNGVFDPPVALANAPGLFSPITTTPVADHGTSSSSASPSPTPTLPTGTSTQTPVSAQASSTSSPPNGGNPGGGGGSPGGGSTPASSPTAGSPSSNSPSNQTPNQNPSSPVPASPTSTPVVAGTTLFVNPSGVVVIAGQTLTPGGSAITVSGTVVSLAPGGTQVVIAGTTSQIGGAIITPLSTGLIPPSGIAPGSGAGRIGGGGIGMWSVLVGAVAGVMMWL